MVALLGLATQARGGRSSGVLCLRPCASGVQVAGGWLYRSKYHIVVNDSSHKHSYELISLMSGQKGKLSLSHSVISYP